MKNILLLILISTTIPPFAQENTWIIKLNNGVSFERIKLNSLKEDSLSFNYLNMNVLQKVNDIAEIRCIKERHLTIGIISGVIPSLILDSVLGDKGMPSEMGVALHAGVSIVERIGWTILGGVLGEALGALISVNADSDSVYDFREISEQNKIQIIQKAL